MMSATVLAESFADSDAVSVLLHELGHQLGARAHYGDCTGAYLSPLVSSDSECIGDWDIMGYDSRYPQPTAYTRIDRGWLTPAATATVPLGPTGFPATVVLRSVSVDACPSSAASVWRTPYERLACLRRPIAVGAGNAARGPLVTVLSRGDPDPRRADRRHGPVPAVPGGRTSPIRVRLDPSEKPCSSGSVWDPARRCW